jgi:hypothetical protein
LKQVMINNIFRYTNLLPIPKHFLPYPMLHMDLHQMGNFQQEKL